METIIAGLYNIKNLATGNEWFGISPDYNRRVETHMWCLRQGFHEDPQLQSEFSHYGEDSFEFELLESYGPERIRLLEPQPLWRGEQVRFKVAWVRRKMAAAASQLHSDTTVTTAI